MAHNTPNTPAPVRSKRKANVKQEGLLTIGFFAISFVAVFILNRVVGLGQVASVAIAVLLGAVVIFASFRSMMKQRWKAENQDAEKTVVPIIERYGKSHSAKMLVNDYQTWSEGRHDIDLQLQFLQLIVEALVNDHHAREARKMLAEMERVSVKAGAGDNFALYKADVEARLK